MWWLHSRSVRFGNPAAHAIVIMTPNTDTFCPAGQHEWATTTDAIRKKPTWQSQMSIHENREVLEHCHVLPKVQETCESPSEGLCLERGRLAVVVQ